MLAALAVTLAAALTLVPFASAADDYLFRNGHLVTMEAEAVIRADLLVRDGRIAAIGPALEAPGSTVIDMVGGYLVPGLAEMHAHVPSPGQGRRYRDDVLMLWLANGITTARGMLGHPDHLALREQLAAHALPGPRLVTSGPSFNGNSVSSPAQARAMVRAQKAAGYDFLKIHPGLTRAEFEAVADEAKSQGIPFAGHVTAAVGLLDSLALGQLTVDHLDGYLEALTPDLAERADAASSFFGLALAPHVDPAGIPKLVAATKAAGAWVVPTETLMENVARAGELQSLLARPEIRYLPRGLLADYRERLAGSAVDPALAARFLEIRKRLIKALHDGGAGVLLGADSPQIFNVPGFSIHRELESMVAAGLTPYEALRTGTVNPAEFFGKADEFGRLAPGLAADLVLLEANPLTDIRNTSRIVGVMARGWWLGPSARAAALAEIARD